MKYCVVNDLTPFEFHDSVWKLETFEAGALTLRVKELNLHRDAALNPCDCDMEIEEARMTFEGVRILTHTPSVRWKDDAAGISRPVEATVTCTGESAEERLFHELRHGINVFSLEETNGRCKICACGDDPYFEAEFSAEAVRIEWDALRGPAWYETRRK